LNEASQRAPRTEVARFILSDMDSAIMLMQNNSPDGQKNRLSRLVALQYNSRDALYEATFLKYFKATAFVPNGEGWPGKQKDYHSLHNYASGRIVDEIEFFLREAIAAAKEDADNVPLVDISHHFPQTASDAFNPCCSMFSIVEMSGF